MYVCKMDAGRRKFLLYQPGSAGGVVTAVRGSSLSPLSMSSLSSATSGDDRGSAARVGDWLRTDIDWTVKYLTSDQARSSPFTVASRLSRTGGELLAPSTCTSAGSRHYRMRVFSVSSCVFVVIIMLLGGRRRHDRRSTVCVLG